MTPADHGDARLTRALLLCGVTAGPLYVLVGLAQVVTREGFDVRRHALSLLSNGDLGWIQITNFCVSGALVIAGAAGIRRRLRRPSAPPMTSPSGGAWGPLLLAVYGAGLIGAGLFPADPGQGFPPGTPLSGTGISTSGLMHFVFGGAGFYALIAACVVFGRRFARLGERTWAIWSMLTGLVFFVAFAAIASGQNSPAIVLGFYGAVVWIWIWHTALGWNLLREG